MSIDQYLALSGLQVADLPPGFAGSFANFQHQLNLLDSTVDTEAKWQYQVPQLGEGGTCSLFDQLADEPYDLSVILGGKSPANEQMLKQVGALVDFYQKHSASQWFGVYQKRVNALGDLVLVKLAYFGAPSRAEFPLTPEFAAMSNNSTVGLSGKARIINDVGIYLSTGGEYYTCDPKVQSEACLPLFADDGSLIGIVDSEAFNKNVFIGKELTLLLSVVVKLSGILR